MSGDAGTGGILPEDAETNEKSRSDSFQIRPIAIELMPQPTFPAPDADQKKFNSRLVAPTLLAAMGSHGPRRRIQNALASASGKTFRMASISGNVSCISSG